MHDKASKPRYTLLHSDLDQFKLVNDEYGHAEGDRALISFARQLVHEFRDTDVLARSGGDEFVALLTNSSKEFAEESVARFQRALDQYNDQENCGYRINFSHGIAWVDPESKKSVESLLSQADQLMYNRKVIS